MKSAIKTRLLFAGGLVLFSCLAVAKEPNQEDAQRLERLCNSHLASFEALPDSDAFQFLKDHFDPAVAFDRMLASAISNKRYGVLQPFFADASCYHRLLAATTEMPDTRTKDELVINMLRWECPWFWKPDVLPDVSFDMSRALHLTRKTAIEPFVGVISKYLPALSINEDLLATKAKRAKLADQLQAEMERVTRNAEERGLRHGRPVPGDTGHRIRQGSASGTDELDKQSDVGSAVPTAAIAGACLLVLAAAVWLVVRRLSRGNG